jgi:hypothetical protein
LSFLYLKGKKEEEGKKQKRKGREGKRRRKGTGSRETARQELHGPVCREGGDKMNVLSTQGNTWGSLWYESNFAFPRYLKGKYTTTLPSLWWKGTGRGKKVAESLAGSICKLNQMYCSKFTVGHLFFFLISFQYRMKG